MWSRLKNEDEHEDSEVEYTQEPEVVANDVEIESANQQPAPRAVLLQTIYGRRKYTEYPARKSKTLGELQIGVGIMAALLNGIGLYLQQRRVYINVSFYVISGLWGLIFFCLSGGFAIAAGRRKTPCYIITHLVLAIFGSAAGFILAGQGAGGIAFEITNGKDTGHLDKYDLTTEHHYVMASLVISVFLLLCGLLEMGMAVWGSAISCQAVCCGMESTAYAASHALHPGQPMIVVNGRAQAIIDRRGGHVAGLTTGTPAAATHGDSRPYNPS